MKKIYVNPRVTVIDCNAEVMQVNGSTVYGGKYDDWAPKMGGDESYEAKGTRSWSELN